MAKSKSPKKTNIQAHGNVTDDLHKDNENNITSSNSTTNTSTQAKSAKKSTQTANNSNTDNENNAISLNNTKTKAKIGNKSIELPDGTSIDNDNNAASSKNIKPKMSKKSSELPDRTSIENENNTKPSDKVNVKEVQKLALIAADAYKKEEEINVNKIKKIEDNEFLLLATHSNPNTGYNGKVLQDVKTKEIFVAHAGSDDLKDWEINGFMLAKRINFQEADSNQLTKMAKEIADKQYEKNHNQPKPEIIQIGHSLGANHAQINAFKHDQKGVTFNGYGAAGLKSIPTGDDKVTNYVMAADPVSAASTHYGKEVILTNQENINTIKKLTNPLELKGVGSGRIVITPKPGIKDDIKKVHAIDNFTDPNSVLGSKENYDRAIALTKSHEQDIYIYRDNLHGSHDRIGTAAEIGLSTFSNPPFPGIPYPGSPAHIKTTLEIISAINERHTDERERRQLEPKLSDYEKPSYHALPSSCEDAKIRSLDDKFITLPLPQNPSKKEFIQYGFAALHSKDGPERDKAINCLLASDIGQEMQQRTEQNVSSLQREKEPEEQLRLALESEKSMRMQ